MKINGNVLKTYESNAGKKTKKMTKEDSQNLESMKGDTLSISSSQVKEVSITSFSEAKDLLSAIKQGIKHKPGLIETAHEKSNAKNANFLLK